MNLAVSIFLHIFLKYVCKLYICSIIYFMKTTPQTSSPLLPSPAYWTDSSPLLPPWQPTELMFTDLHGIATCGYFQHHMCCETGLAHTPPSQVCVEYPSIGTCTLPIIFAQKTEYWSQPELTYCKYRLTQLSQFRGQILCSSFEGSAFCLM